MQARQTIKERKAEEAYQDWLRQLRDKTSIPLAQGELFNHPFEWRGLIAERLIDFIRVHLSQVGGITPGRKLQLFAEQYGVRTAWHGPGDMSPLAHAANIHIDLAASFAGKVYAIRVPR